jgi:hypothetical protein
VTRPEWLAEPGPAPLLDPGTLELIVGDAARRAAAIGRGEPDPRDDDPLVDADPLRQAPRFVRRKGISIIPDGPWHYGLSLVRQDWGEACSDLAFECAG